MSQINPLQDALEALRVQFSRLAPDLSRQLQDRNPEFVAALRQTIMYGGGDHIDPPELGPDDRQPEDIPNSALFDGTWDEQPPRRLGDVWEGKGDYNDPWVPGDSRHDQDLLTRRMRADSDKNLDLSASSE